jgi:hypothetical protein
MILLFANNAITTIADPITAASVTVQVAAGTGVLFPQPIAGQQFFKLTFVSAQDSAVNEIVNVTAVNGDVFTIVRGQEGTEPTAFNAGDSAMNLTTAQTQANFIQVQQAQTGGTNYAVDTGTPNSYVIGLTPAVTTRIEGLYARIKALNSNTGPSTLNIGAGSFPIVNPDGSPLGEGAIVGGGIFEVVDDGTENYQLISASQEAQSSAGILTTGAMTTRLTAEVIAGWIIANATTIGSAASNATQRANADTANLFTWHWDNFSNTQCPVFTSAGVATIRGANAAADFAANVQIQVYDKRGKGEIGVDTMGGAATARLTGVPVTSGALTTPGSVFGENLHTLIAAQIPAISSAGGALGVSVSVSGSISGSTTGLFNQGVNISASNSQATNVGGSGPAVSLGVVGSFSGSGSGSTSGQNVVSNNTGGAAHNNVMLVDGVTYYLKL